jgi:hypothetical protein
MDKVLPINTILNGDCLELLKTLPDESVDAVCTDPPYGLGTREPTGEDIEKYLRGESLDTGGDFMGKEWEIPPVAVWRECFRVLKPGGHVAAFAGCYDELTEVLTRRGWVKFPDVTIDDEFASMDLSSMKVEWQRPKEIVRQPHDGQMIRYKTNKIDLLVTPNHKVVTSSMKAREYRLERADSHPPRVRMLKTSKGRVDEEDLGVFCLPAVMQTTSQGHQIELPEKVIPLDAWLPFFGLYLAKGSTSLIKNKLQNSHEHGSSYNVSISHFDTENLREIQRRLSEWFDVKLYLEIGLIHINDKQLQSYLSQFGKARERFIPNWVKRLPPSRLRVLWDWYMRGGGHAHRVGYTSSTRLRDDFQEIAMYMGMSADWVTRKPKKEFASINGRTITNHRPLYDVTFNHVQNYPQVSATRGRNPPRTVLSAQDWGGCMVYCVELERHHTLYVRRNGKAVWCGNTRTWDIMSVGIRAAGFEKRDTIATLFGPLSILCWVQGQGFPKSHNVFKTDIVPMVQEALVEKGYAAPFNWKHDNEAMVPGEAPETVEVTLFDIAFQITKHRDNEWELPYDLVKWKGYGTALKPSFEPILVFRKPLEGTLAETVLGGGAGVIDIDGTRVKHASAEDKAAHQAMVEAIKARAGVWQTCRTRAVGRRTSSSCIPRSAGRLGPRRSTPPSSTSSRRG